MNPLYHGVLQDTSQMTSSTISKREKQKVKKKGTRVLYTNLRLTYSHSYSEMMNVKVSTAGMLYLITKGR